METGDLSRLKIEEADRHSGGHARRRLPRLTWWIIICLLGMVTVGVLAKTGLLTRPVEVQSFKVAPIYPAQALTVLNASGYVVAQKKAAVSSKATGRLARLNVEEGQRVKAGDIIGVLENDDLKALLDEARAAMRVAESTLKNAEAELVDATLSYERQKSLRQAGAVSEQAFDSAEARYKKAMAMEKSARFGVERAEASIKVAEVNLEYSYIRAPFDGVILTKNADEGEVVAPFGGSATAKAAVATMADLDSLMVEADVSESNLEKVASGGACEIRLDAFPKDRFPGSVHMIVPTADRSKATVMTKVKFAELDDRVLPEMSARVGFLSRSLKNDEQESVLAVPVSAIRNTPHVRRAFLIENGRVKVVEVKTGRTWGETVEVLAGLRDGDMVVLKADKDLADGVRVKVAQ